MKHLARTGIAVLFLSSLLTAGFAASSSDEKSNGRYALYIVQVDTKQVPVLLDTQTGKVWWYTEEQAVGSSIAGGVKAKFQGVTVEGLLYATKDAPDLDKALELLQSSGFVNKELKGFKENISGQFSYGIDVEKAQGISDKLKSALPKKE
jgi:hypothetical protein